MKTHTKKQRELRNTLIGWLLVMPSLIFMAAFTVWPVFRSIWLSLTKYKLGMSAPEFIGLKNYISLAGSSLFWKVMGNTLFFALITIVPSMVVGLFLATLVNRKSRLIGFVRTSYFYPVVMPMIAIASIWMFIYMAKNGLLDQMLISMGLQPMNILSSKKTVLPAMAFMYVWKEAGYLMPLDANRFYSPFISGMQRLPNGNTMITEGSHGRIFEVTPEHELVWEYVCPYWGTALPMNMVYRSYRLPYEWVPQLEKPAELPIERLDVSTFRVPGAAAPGVKSAVKIKEAKGYFGLSAMCVAADIEE